VASVNHTKQEMQYVQEVGRREPRNVGYSMYSLRTVGWQSQTLNLSGLNHSFESDPAKCDGEFALLR
jgi:hypothetical protein